MFPIVLAKMMTKSTTMYDLHRPLTVQIRMENPLLDGRARKWESQLHPQYFTIIVSHQSDVKPLVLLALLKRIFGLFPDIVFLFDIYYVLILFNLSYISLVLHELIFLCHWLWQNLRATVGAIMILLTDLLCSKTICHKFMVFPMCMKQKSVLKI